MNVVYDHPLAPYTTLGLGGPARYWIEATDAGEVPAALQWAESRQVPVLVLGGGSNLVVADAGFDGLVLRVAHGGLQWHGVDLTAAAGDRWDALVETTVAEGLAGLECLSGIPGNVGATPMQNVGAYGQEVSDTIQRVHAWDRAARARVELAAADCEFSYRHSRFKGRDAQRYVILAVTYRLQREVPAPVRYGELARALADGPDTVAVRRQTVLRLRAGKGMLLNAADSDTRSVGSFFLNPVVETDAAPAIESRAAAGPMPQHPASPGHVKLSAAWLIEKAGFAKGFGGPHVFVSGKHTLALVHRGGGTTAELLELARNVRDGVQARLGVRLSPEANLIGCSLD